MFLSLVILIFNKTQIKITQQIVQQILSTQGDSYLSNPTKPFSVRISHYRRDFGIGAVVKWERNEIFEPFSNELFALYLLIESLTEKLMNLEQSVVGSVLLVEFF